jgi:nitrate reductase gamma subunit
MLDTLFFGAFPYVAVVLFLTISIYRYRKNAYTISSLSSQFLESRKLFWGSLPFHLGIITLFFGHLIGFLIPRQVMAWNEHPARLLVLELTGLVAGLLALFGLTLLIGRRLTSDRLRPVTSRIDLVLYTVLIFDVVTGLVVALGYRWGSGWYVHVLAPYLKSLFHFQPNVALVADLPLVAKLHVVGAFALFTLFSFTRLMHILVAPVPYLWRRTQLVLWNRDRRKARPVA